MSLQLIPLSDEIIAKHKYDLCDLWMIKFNNDLMGPFHSTQILEEIARKNPMLEDCNAYNLETEQWHAVYKWPAFQRRVPQLVPVKELIAETSFFILKNGQSFGPFTLEHLENELKVGNYTSSDMIRASEDEAWTKICEHANFDRRSLDQKPLPAKPKQELFEINDQKILTLITKKENEKEQEDALVGLAFIVHGNDKGQTISNKKAATRETQSVSSSKSSAPKIPFQFNFNWDFLTNLKNSKTLIYSAASISIVLLFFTVMNSINSSFDNSNDIQFVKNNKKDIKLPSVKKQRKPASTVNKKSKIKRLAPVKTTPPSESKVVRKSKEDSERDLYDKDDRYPYEEEPMVHRYPENDAEIDVNDPTVREQISRELASDMPDAAYSDAQRKEIEREIRNEIDNEAESYLEERAEQYEQVSDF